MQDRHLIAVDEHRAAGALDVPPAWRKSLGVERDLFSGSFALEDDDSRPEQERARLDAEADGSADEDSVNESPEADKPHGS